MRKEVINLENWLNIIKAENTPHANQEKLVLLGLFLDNLRRVNKVPGAENINRMISELNQEMSLRKNMFSMVKNSGTYTIKLDELKEKLAGQKVLFSIILAQFQQQIPTDFSREALIASSALTDCQESLKNIKININTELKQL